MEILAAAGNDRLGKRPDPPQPFGAWPKRTYVAWQLISMRRRGCEFPGGATTLNGIHSVFFASGDSETRNELRATGLNVALPAAGDLF